MTTQLQDDWSCTCLEEVPEEGLFVLVEELKTGDWSSEHCTWRSYQTEKMPPVQHLKLSLVRVVACYELTAACKHHTKNSWISDFVSSLEQKCWHLKEDNTWFCETIVLSWKIIQGCLCVSTCANATCETPGEDTERQLKGTFIKFDFGK